MTRKPTPDILDPVSQETSTIDAVAAAMAMPSWAKAPPFTPPQPSLSTRSGDGDPLAVGQLDKTNGVFAREHARELDALFGPGVDGHAVVPLVVIDDNPFQERSDYGDLSDLAGDIRQHGLLQPPVVRSVAGGRYQLAFGHRRRRACEIAGLVTIPVVVRQLSDEEMATIAFSENEQRADVSVIDKAVAIQTMQARFGWTQQEIADKLSIARPTVANLLRMLRLPDDLQVKLAAGDISMRQAEALLSLSELPQEITDMAEAHYDPAMRPSVIVRDALGGASSDEIRKRTLRVIQHSTRPVHEEPWYKHSFNGAAYRAAVCQQCPIAVKRDSGVHCPDGACQNAKRIGWDTLQLQPASAASGWPIADPPYSVSTTEYFTYADSGHVAEIFAMDPCCPSLGLIRVEDRNHRRNSHQPDGHPEAVIVCQKANGCSCLRSRKAALTRSGADDAQRTSKRFLNAMADDARGPLAELVGGIPEEVLRVVAGAVLSQRGYPGEYGNEERNVLLAGVEQLRVELVEWLIGRQLLDYRSPAKNRDALAVMLAVGGIESPWATEEEGVA